MKNLLTLSGLFGALSAMPAAAQEGLRIIGRPVDGAMGFQPAATKLARDQQWLDYMIMVIITLIVIFVVAMIFWIILRYNRRFHPVASQFTHNTPVEIAWTLLPIVILVLIGAFSLPVLFEQQEIPKGDITIKITGNQWFWNYEYVGNDFSFDSYLLGSNPTIDTSVRPADADVTAYVLDDAMRAKLADAGYNEDEFLLAVDQPMVIPVGKTIVVQITGSDVIHSWALPAFAVKQDAVPGRVAGAWFNVDEEGIYFGQCSELCGKDHAYMPIAVRVVSQQDYDRWLDGAIKEFAGTPRPIAVAPIAVASN